MSLLDEKAKKYRVKKIVTCAKCDIAFENVQMDKYYTYCPNCGRVKDTRDRSESNKQRKENRKSKGLCTYCGNEKPEENRTRCRNCINIFTSKKKLNRQIKLEAGLWQQVWQGTHNYR